MLAFDTRVEQTLGIGHGLQQAGTLDAEGATVGRVLAVTHEALFLDPDATTDTTVGTGGVHGFGHLSDLCGRN